MDAIPRRRFTDEFKAQAVLLVSSLGQAGAARKLGISNKTLAHWVAAARDGRPVSSSKRLAVTEMEAENARLRAENVTLRMERDVLKKATAFFAKESR